MAKRYILREYGSWCVMILAYLAGVSAAGRFNVDSIAVLAAIVFYVNSKQALTRWFRSKGPDSRRPLAVFLAQIIVATLLMAGVALHYLATVLPFLGIAAAYLFFFRFRGEHFILTEITGFFLLAAAAPLAELGASGIFDVRLYIAVAVFFTAGVFKVRVQFTRLDMYRILMAAYLAFALTIYYLLAVPFVALIPLLDNLYFAATLYKVRLRTAGWLEVAKGALFVVLISAAYGGH